MDTTLCRATASNAVAAFHIIYHINLESSLQDQSVFKSVFDECLGRFPSYTVNQFFTSDHPSDVRCP